MQRKSILGLALLFAATAHGGLFETWNCRARVAFPGYDRPEPLTNFPVLVVLGTNAIPGFGYSQFADGTNDDLRFTDDESTTELNHEIDTWNTNGNSLIWVQVPLLTSNTAIRVYWGRPGQSAPACRSDGSTWQDYVGVWHMNEADARDASGNGNDGIAQSNAIAPAAGRIGSAAALAGGSNDWILVGDSASLDLTAAVTLEGWVYNASNDAQPRAIMAKRSTGGLAEAYYLFKHTNNKINANIGNDRDAGNTSLPTNAWRHVAMTYDSAQAAALRKRFYFEGMADGVVTDLSAAIPATTANLQFGVLEPGYGSRWIGKLDELRVSRVARGTNWLWAGWMTVASNTLFQSYGSTVVAMPTAVTLDVTNVTSGAATLRGQLVSTGTFASAVYAYWGQTDGGQEAGLWEHECRWPAPQGPGPLATNIALPMADRIYYYRYAASNEAGLAWSPSSTSFINGGVWVDAAGTAAEAGLVPATFTVHRAGTAASEALTVSYALGGTATPGADYAALSGRVTLAAGEETATVTVAPLFDRQPMEGTETVALALLPGAYVIGSPAGATLDLTDNTGVGYLYVWTNSVAEAEPYNTWETAAHDIQKAITYCSTNLGTFGTVIVTNGSYGLSVPLLITNGVSLRSTGGRAVTTLYRLSTAAATNVLSLRAAAADAVVDGFTITNGTVSGVVLAAGTLQNCDVAFNSAKSAGGLDLTGNATVRVCRIYGNWIDTSGASGGGVRLQSAGAVLEDCIVSNNVNRMNNGKGGGVTMSAGTVRRCVIANNTSVNTAGGMALSGGTVRNCLIQGNSSLGSGGVQLDGAVAVLENCTVVQNTNTLETSVGGGVRVTVNGGTIRNCIVWNNWDFGRASSENVSLAGGTCTYSCVTPLVAGIGNIDAQPGFRSPLSGDYRLSLGSPCIDAGQGLAGVTDDLDGAARPQDGNGDAAAVHDMGAYEARGTAEGALRCGFYAATNAGLDSLDAAFTAWVGGTNLDGLYYRWDFDMNGSDDAEGADLASVTHSYSVGWYGVRLTVTNAAGETAVAETAGYVTVAPSVVYVAPSGTPVWPYDSWATAATNFSDALRATWAGATTGSTILVTNGSYALSTTPLVLAQNITLRGYNGVPTLWRTAAAPATAVVSMQAAGAVLDGVAVTNGAMGGIQLAAGTVRNCLVERNANFGVTLTGGTLEDSIVRRNAGRSGGGVNLSVAGAAVRRCIIEQNTGSYSDGSGKGIGLVMTAAGLVEGCTIRRNSNLAATANAGGGAGARLTAGVMRNCLVVSNSYPASTGRSYGGGVWLDNGGTLENCTIIDNAAGTSGGGLHQSGGTVTNCIVYYNTCTPDNPLSNNVGRTAGQLAYSCSTPLEPGPGNLVAAPSFVDRPGGDYHLALGSPGTDVGATLASVTNDLDGVSRPQGAGHDLGAYEYVASGGGPIECNFSGTPLEEVGTLDVTFTGTASGGSDANYVYAWDFENDGSIDAGGPGNSTVSHTYGPGRWSVALTVSNASGETTNKVLAGYVTVAPLTVHVATNGGHVFPFGSWADAAVDIQSAVDAARLSATTNSSVLVSNGTYVVSNSVTITKAVPVRSVGGAAVTTITRGTGTFAVVTLNSSGAVLDGFTITNGNSGGLSINAGTLRNSIIRNNASGGLIMTGGTVEDCDVAYNTGRATVALDMNGAGAVVRRCRIYANVGSFNGGGTGAGVGIGSSGGWLENSIIANNTNAGGQCAGVNFSGPGTVRNCLIADNSAADGGGVRLNHAAARLENCTLVRNVTSGTGGGLYVIAGGSVTNCIIYHNRTGAGIADNVHSSGVARCAYTCAPELTAGVNRNTPADPRFMSVANGDYRLHAQSPAYGTGVNQPWMTNGTDLAGGPRVRGALVDMGAFESEAAAGMVFVVQ